MTRLFAILCTGFCVFTLASSTPTSMINAQEATRAAAEPVFVQTQKLPARGQAQTRQFFGQVAALETVDISFQVGGHLSFLEAREGAWIKEGTLLAQLDLTSFDTAVERAELSLAQARRTLTRSEMLTKTNVGSQVQVENAQIARDLADVALREARKARSDARINAPFDALVADRIGTNFATITPGIAIMRLHNMSQIRVVFDLPERVLAHIGDPSQVTFTGRLAGVAEPIALEFYELRTETGSVGQSYTISLGARPAPELNLLPGRSMVVQASIAATSDLPVLPATAIATQPDGQTVVVSIAQSPNGLTAHHIPVTISSTNGTQFTVENLPDDLEIVSIGAHLIADGQAVKRFTGLTVEGL